MLAFALTSPPPAGTEIYKVPFESRYVWLTHEQVFLIQMAATLAVLALGYFLLRFVFDTKKPA